MRDPDPRTRILDSVTDTVTVAPIVPSDVLLPLLVEATSSLHSAAPLLLPCRVLAYRDSLAPDLSGAYAALIGGIDSVYLGVLADPTSSLTIARRLFSTQAELDELKVRTAMCDIVRMLACGLKRRIRTMRSVAVTEPVFVSGVVRSGGDHALRAAEVVLGVTRATLVVVARSGSGNRVAESDGSNPVATNDGERLSDMEDPS